MFILIRTLTYGTVFVSLVLIFVPYRILSWSGIIQPESFGIQQIVGMLIVFIGAGLTTWCVLSFVRLGKGTPAPFDPPRKLVVKGPYRYVRNPMYIGAGIALVGAAIYYSSIPLLAYVILFFIITHLFVVLYEEPTLQNIFGTDYLDYKKQAKRWWPSI